MDIKELRRCKNCAAWERIGNSVKGECRINPPMANKEGDAVWPKPHEDKWCIAFLITKEIAAQLKASSIVIPRPGPPPANINRG